MIVLGAGAAGLMAAAVAGQRGRRVRVLDHAKRPGEKIRISGGGRCNFTNLHSGPENFLSNNPHFCKSALAGYGPQDFIAMVDRYGIAWHEKTKGQLFCDGRSQQIIDMLLAECRAGGVAVETGVTVGAVERSNEGFTIGIDDGTLEADAVIVATGGPSIPKMGASDFAYRLARSFGLGVIEPRPGLVPLTFTDALKEPLAALAGVSVASVVQTGRTAFDEALLFTHRGLSGPAILQISSYWSPGASIAIDMAPGTDVLGALKAARKATPKVSAASFLAGMLPKRLAQFVGEGGPTRLADASDTVLARLAGAVQDWQVKPAGTEGFRTAEVTLGGVDTDGLSSRTMEAKAVPGLHFSGEAVDVTGHLGGHNFQWAWASGVAAGKAV